MRKYYIPPTIKEKEKVIGGVLTLGQFMYLIVGLVIGLVTGVVLYILTKSIEIAIVAILAGIGAGIPFAFYKKNGLTLLQYIKYKKIFLKKYKKLPKKRKEVIKNEY